MTNEQQKAKELAELLNAFADGKQLQFFNDNDNCWCDYDATIMSIVKEFFDVTGLIIRIKPETKRIALTQQDLIDRINKGKTNNIVFEGNVFTCVCFGNTSVHYKIVVSNSNARYDTLCFWYDKMKDLIFADGTPCYEEVECE